MILLINGIFQTTLNALTESISVCFEYSESLYIIISNIFQLQDIADANLYKFIIINMNFYGKQT